MKKNGYEKQEIKIGNLFDYRTYWMGIAMLWVVAFHTGIEAPGLLKDIVFVGYGGVDIFIFASGIGNYFSYNRDLSPLDFLKRRVTRLAPTYIPFIVIWVIVNCALGEITYYEVVGNLFGIQGFSSNGGDFNWYISGILICYLLTPYLAEFVKVNNKLKNVCLVICLLLISSIFWTDTNRLMCFSRLPLYVVGMMFAKHENSIITKKTSIVSLMSFVVGTSSLYICRTYFSELLAVRGLHWYPFIFIAPPLCIFISGVIKFSEDSNALKKITKPILYILRLVGESSFEIYLLHIFVFDLIRRVYGCNGIITFCAAIISIAVGIGWSMFAKYLKKTLGNYRDNRHESKENMA